MLRWYLTRLYKLLDLCNYNLCCCCHICVEISGCFCEVQISIFVRFFCFNYCKITEYCLLLNVLLIVEDLCLLYWRKYFRFSSSLLILYDYFSFFDIGICASFGIKCRYSSSSWPDFLSQCSLRCQFNFQISTQILTLQSFVSSKIWDHRSLDLLFL